MSCGNYNWLPVSGQTQGGQIRTSRGSWYCHLVIRLFLGQRLVREKSLLGPTYHGGRYGLRGDGGCGC